jgi:hypothetical protein
MTALKSVGTQAIITEFLINYADLLFGDSLVTTLVGRRNGSGKCAFSSPEFNILQCLKIRIHIGFCL